MQRERKEKKKKKGKKSALTGNRTRASRVAGENSTTEPSVPNRLLCCTFCCYCWVQVHSFDGSVDNAKHYVDFGLYIGINGW